MVAMNWREGVRVVRGSHLTAELQAAAGRATAFEFEGAGGSRTWFGVVVLNPGANTGAHHHGRHEVAVYVARGTVEIRWGERLEHAAETAAGDFVYFSAGVPHQERNLSASEVVRFVVVRSDGERITTPLAAVPEEKPETVY